MGTLCGVVVHAAEFKGMAGFGYDFGGETLVSATNSEGRTAKLNANEGQVWYGGLLMVTDEFETQATIGYKSGRLDATTGSLSISATPIYLNGKNGYVAFTAIPVELLEFYRVGNIRLGLGFSYIINPTVVIDTTPNTSGTNGTYKFDNTVATLAQIGWVPDSGYFSIDLRITSVKYKQNSPATSRDFSGGSAGVYFNVFF